MKCRKCGMMQKRSNLVLYLKDAIVDGTLDTVEILSDIDSKVKLMYLETVRMQPI